MLGKKENKTQTNPTSAINVIGEGTQIHGDLISNGDVRIDGRVEGNLKTTGKCVIGPSGFVQGNIEAKNADLSGTLNGNLRVKELLLLKSSGKINGDIVTSKIVVENGGEFNGSCTMGNATDNKKNGQSATK